MMRAPLLAVAAAAAMLSACAVRPLVTNRVAIEFPEDKTVVKVSTVTVISDDPPPTTLMEQRVASEREALNAQRDEWTLRYAGLHPDHERVMVERRHGLIQRVEHSATIPREELGRFFDDSGISVSWTGGGGTSELVIAPQGSKRATREQREHVMALLHAFSIDAAAYLDALAHLYAWLDANPQQTSVAYRLIFNESERAVNEEEQALIDAVRTTSQRITERLDSERDEQYTLDEQFDLVFNPFSSEISVTVPRYHTVIENFIEQKDGTLVIPRSGLLDAVQSLEGRWAAPDPLAMSLRGEVRLAQMLAVPRHYTPVLTAGEIERAIVEKLKTASVYRVRWNE